LNHHAPQTDEKAAEVATSFIDLYGPVAELEVARRILMFEEEGDAKAVAAWRKVGEQLRQLRGHPERRP
jgi:hypothetical protein